MGPGGIGARTEQFSSSIGTRAAGLVTEIIEPQTLVALSNGMLTPAQAAMLSSSTARGRRGLTPFLEQFLVSAASDNVAAGPQGQRLLASFGTLPLISPDDVDELTRIATSRSRE